MKSTKHMLKLILGLISAGFFAVYIAFYLMNCAVAGENLFRTYVDKTVFLIMGLLAAAVSVILIADDRRALRRRLKRRRRAVSREEAVR